MARGLGRVELGVKVRVVGFGAERIMKNLMRCVVWCVASAVAVVAPAVAQPSLVSHVVNQQVFGEPSGVTGREPDAPRQDETVDLWIKVGPSFTYDRVYVYYTIDGTDPAGTNGNAGTPSTRVLANQYSGPQPRPGDVLFVRNQGNGFGGNDDWWRVRISNTPDYPFGTLRQYNRQVRYRISAASSSSGAELFAGGTLGGGGGTTFAYTNKLAWPGRGNSADAGQPDGEGYPNIAFWKEEGVVGNGWINSIIDQNGTWFDVYYPGAGGVFGVGTKNEGYVDGLDTFPAGLPLDNRGQMHINQAVVGIRSGGFTNWLSNKRGTDFVNVQQTYLARTNTVRTTSTLASANLNVTLWDFAPRDVVSGGNPVRNLVIKRMRLENPDAQAKTVEVYLYMDPAINGGDNADLMFFDASRGAMVALDNTFRNVFNTGSIGAGQEYNPTTSGSYTKNVSVYLGGAMRVAPSATAGGVGASDSWRDTSGDNSQGWIGRQVTVPASGEVWVDFAIVGGFDGFAGATGTYNAQMVPTIDWFLSANLDAALATTNGSWTNLVTGGVTVDTPDDGIDALFERGILGTMLHFDEKNGGLIAGFRNGAYPYVWPRDMAWAAVTLARTGHNDVVVRMTRYLRDVTQRDFETWTPGNTPGVEAAGGAPFFGTRKGFWKQKYSTDGGVIWGAPQVDETAVLPWMVKYNYDVTGDLAYLTEAQAGNPANTNYAIVKDAAIAMSQTSKNDGTRLNHRPAYPGSTALLMYSNNIWEDQYDTFIYSNANIVRGLRDAAAIASVLGNTADAADFTNRANGIMAGLNAKLDWNGENTDASLLGIVYPFETHSPVDARAVRVIDRINGVATNRFGQTQPLVRFAGEYINDASDYVGLVDRYWGDSYWGNAALGPTRAGPWFLTTMWYGVYYAMRQDYTPGTGDIDNHLFRLNRTADHNGPLGFGAEQMAPSNSLQYPGQSDFTLQTAWPNAWESMSFYVDSVMAFLGYTPDAPGNTLRIRPRLPGAWSTMTFNNLRVGAGRVNVTVAKDARGATHTMTTTTPGSMGFDTVVRIPSGRTPCTVTLNGVSVTPASVDTVIGAVRVSGTLPGGQASVLRVELFSLADIAGPGPSDGADGELTADDVILFISRFTASDARADIAGPGPTLGADGEFTADDIILFINRFTAGC
jgi:GH15 family glucan-1,4-alpha-glucosidase